MKDLTSKQIERIDFLHNSVHQMLCSLAGREIEWDISVIGEICDVAEDHICSNLGIMKDMEFYPYVED